MRKEIYTLHSFEGLGHELKNTVMTSCKAALINVGLAAGNNVEKTFFFVFRLSGLKQKEHSDVELIPHLERLL